CIDPPVADLPLSSVTVGVPYIVPLTSCHTSTAVSAIRRRVTVASLPTFPLFRSVLGRHTLRFSWIPSSWPFRPRALFLERVILPGRPTERVAAEFTVTRVSMRPDARVGTFGDPGRSSGPVETGHACRRDRSQQWLSGGPTLFTHQGNHFRARLIVHRHKRIPTTKQGAGT
ncbi:unnamed protein product, partial [Laminaria digitata]